MSYGSLAPILLSLLLFFREQVWQKLHGCRSITFKVLNKCENLIRDVTPRIMGPWPLFYYNTSLFSGSKCDISFRDVGPETFKLLNKM